MTKILLLADKEFKIPTIDIFKNKKKISTPWVSEWGLEADKLKMQNQRVK